MNIIHEIREIEKMVEEVGLRDGVMAEINRWNRSPLPNFHPVHTYLFRGGVPSRPGLLNLKDIGITTVIDLRQKQFTETELDICRSVGLKHINLPMTNKAPTDEQIKQFIAEVESNKGTATYVHCAHGCNRTGCMVAIWRVVKDGWDYEQAYKEMCEYYFAPNLNELAQAVQREAECLNH